MRETIVICAPYSPVGCGTEPNLGAASKLEGVVRALNRRGRVILFVNSAHNRLAREFRPSVQRVRIGGVSVIEVTPAALPHRKIGKIYALLTMPFLLFWLSRLRPRLAWFYNLYLFEVLFAFFSRCIWSPVSILEYEDSPWARFRRGPVKTIGDGLASLFIFGLYDYAFAVNQRLTIHLRRFGIFSSILPGLLSEVRLAPPVSNRIETHRIRLGYFGGFHAEKGLLILMQLATTDYFKDCIELVLVGDGPLREEALILSSGLPNFKILGPFPDRAQVLACIDGVDICLNPHVDLKSAFAGVFPFKILEYLSRGKPVLTSPLPKGLLPATPFLVETEFSAESLKESIGVLRFECIDPAPNREFSRYLSRFTERNLGARVEEYIASRQGRTEV